MTSRPECHDCGSRPFETAFTLRRKPRGKPLRCCDCQAEAVARRRPLVPSMTRLQRRRLIRTIAAEQLGRDWSPQLDLFFHQRADREPPP